MSMRSIVSQSDISMDIMVNGVTGPGILLSEQNYLGKSLLFDLNTIITFLSLHTTVSALYN